MISEKKLKEIAKKNSKKLSKKSIEIINKKILKYVLELINKSSRKAELYGRSVIKLEDFED